MPVDNPSIPLTEKSMPNMPSESALKMLLDSFLNYLYEQTSEGTALPGKERAVPIEEAVAVLHPHSSTVE